MVDADVVGGGGDDSGGDEDDDDGGGSGGGDDGDVYDNNDDDNLSTHGLPSLPGWLSCFLKGLLKISVLSNSFFE